VKAASVVTGVIHLTIIGRISRFLRETCPRGAFLKLSIVF
jgi:hypothetical protein